MGEVAGELAELTVLTSDNPRSEDPTRIIADIAAGVAKAREFHSEVDREQAIGFALAEARKGDIVVIAGKGHESTQELSNSVISFDDRDVARRALRLLLAGEGRP
jgi:UDP-N-acetylmuramoyl-L-alanyl-D-glutamate--2,6-diaminopimelate ligase